LQQLLQLSIAVIAAIHSNIATIYSNTDLD
jgi:hypothetical protein